MTKRRAPPRDDVSAIDKVKQRLDEMGLDDTSFFKPKEGRNTIRVLPGVGEMDDYFWTVVGKHYIPGAQHATTCPLITADNPCPICEYVSSLYRSTDSDEKDVAKRIRAQRQYWINVINRDKENLGPLIYPAPKTVFAAIASLVRDPDYGAVYDVDVGTDVVITRTGTGIETRYQVQAKRKESPLSDDDDQVAKWLDATIDLTPIELSDDPEEDDYYTRDEEGNLYGIVYIKPYDRLKTEFDAMLTGSDEEEAEAPPMPDDDDDDDDENVRSVIRRRRNRKTPRRTRK